MDAMILLLALTLACTGESAPPMDRDGDGSLATVDCDDLDPTRTPGAPEHCDGYDEDCDGLADNAAIDALTTYADEDGDGFGDATTALAACVAADRRVLDAEDCDDADATVFPGAYETCDGRDQDCDGAVDEDALDARTRYPDADGDGFGDAANALTACAATGVVVGEDCDDGDATVFPGAEERCDAVDTDCDGQPDTNATDGSVWYLDADGDGYGDAADVGIVDCAPSGRAANRFDCDDADAAVNPAGGGCGLPAEGSVADAAITLDGLAEGDGVGTAHHVADLDGDGVGDLLVAAPEIDRLYVLFGPLTGGESLDAPDATLRYTGTASFGSTLAAADLDLDGAAEVLGGAPGDASMGTEGGAVWIFPGPITGSATTSTARAVLSEGSRDRFGYAIVAVPGAEGPPDVLVSAPDYGTAAGRVYLLAADAEDVTDPVATLTGPYPLARAGQSLAAGDLDGDGLAELVIGAAGAQQVYVVDAGRTGSVNLADADATLGGRGGRYRTGASVAVVGDVDGDGLADLLIGAPAETGTVSATGGEAWLLPGPVAADGTLPGAAWATFTGEADGDLGGASVGGGDLDGDGRDDLVLGATGNDRGGGDAGAAYVFYTVPSGTSAMADADSTLLGHAPGVALGSAVTLGDLDGDDRADLVLGGAGETVGGPGAGATWVWAGGAR